MSNAEPVDPELVEETKQQIRALVNEIAQLAASDIPEGEFYDGFLNRVVSALAAYGGVVWDLSSGRLEVAYQIGLRESGILANEDNQMAHGKLLRRLVGGGEAILVQPHSGPGVSEEGEQVDEEDDDAGSNPTEYLLVLGLLRADQEVQGILEIFQRPGTPPATQRGYLRFVSQMCDLAADYLKTRQLRKFGTRQTLWNQVEQFTRAVHRTLDRRSTAYALANEGRRLIECDRVTVAVMKGSKCKIDAVSGQDTFDKRANQIVLLEKLANAVVRQGETVWYTGSTEDMPPQVEDAVQAYVDESHSKTVAIIPLRREKIVDESKPDDHAPEPIVGCLVVEQIEDARPKEGMLQRVEMVAQHGANALANAHEHNSVFLMPIWRAIGKSAWVVKARALPKTVTITLAVAAVIATLCLLPADYNLQGDGTLQPVLRHEVYAQVPGQVLKLHVNTGDRVKKDQPLLEMENHTLKQEFQRVEQQLNESLESRDTIIIQLNSRRLTKEERSEAETKLAVLDTTISELQKQIGALQAQQELLIVRAPIDGEVMTWDLKYKLQTRPIEMGQVLMTIAEPDKDWEVEVDMPEERMGDLSRAQLDWRTANPHADASQGTLPVEYILATDPKTWHQGKVTSIGKTAEVIKQEGSTVRLKIPVEDKSKLKELRPGATVKARVHCGRAAIGYVWFHDLVNFLYSRVLFRFF